jgi:YggT family protein
MSGLVTVSYFLISTLFSLVTFILWLRFGLRYFRISQLHPVRQMIQRMTDPLFIPILKILQIHLTPFQRYDWACLAVLVVVEWLKFLLISLVYFGQVRIWLITGSYALADLIIQPCDLVFYAILIRVIMSWVNPHWQHPLTTILYAVTEPMLQQIRRHLPMISGLDFSPFIMMILLKIVTLFVGASLPFHL